MQMGSYVNTAATVNVAAAVSALEEQRSLLD